MNGTRGQNQAQGHGNFVPPPPPANMAMEQQIAQEQQMQYIQQQQQQQQNEQPELNIQTSGVEVGKMKTYFLVVVDIRDVVPW